MTSSQPLVDHRSAAFARLASRVIVVLNEAVDVRKSQGESVTSIAERIGCHKSALSRVLNGTTRNVTLKTVSDILWATSHDPQDFVADPIESLSPNWVAETVVLEAGDEVRWNFPIHSVIDHSASDHLPVSNIKEFKVEEISL